MTVPYYYIVAGLPDVYLDEGKAGPTLGAFAEEMRELVPAADGYLLDYIGYPIDHRNLMNILLEKQEPFNDSGNFSDEELKKEIKNSDDIPEYMQVFLKAFKDNTQVVQNLSWENQLNWLFYESATSLENEFLSEWFTFELNFRNILAAINCRKANLQPDRHIICRNEVTDLLLKSNAPDFSLSSKLPWSDEVFSMDFDAIADSEKRLDEFRLQMLEEMSVPELFSLETILRLGIRLSIVERWDTLKAEIGKETLHKMIDDLENSYQVD
ncbi:MAG: DUF2764 family protein [Proteobacteria bacterium]|nr:DUF2764 family protein [Pseudomonadota bacterium]